MVLNLNPQLPQGTPDGLIVFTGFLYPLPLSRLLFAVPVTLFPEGCSTSPGNVPLQLREDSHEGSPHWFVLHVPFLSPLSSPGIWKRTCCCCLSYRSLYVNDCLCIGSPTPPCLTWYAGLFTAELGHVLISAPSPSGYPVHYSHMWLLVLLFLLLFSCYKRSLESKFTNPSLQGFVPHNLISSPSILCLLVCFGFYL